MLKSWIHWIFLFASPSLYALTTLNVTLNTDNNPGGIGEPGDLRYCLNSMNQNLNMMPDDYAITFNSPMTIQLNGILPIINNSPNPVSITIGNPSPTSIVTIDGNNKTYRGLFIPMGNVTIQNMNFENLAAKGGDGGDGISGGGGGLGAGGAIYAPQTFLNGSNPSITLMNVSINNCAAIGGKGGNYLGASSTGNEGGGGGGGFSGDGGFITATGSTGGAGGGGFGGNGGTVTLSTDAFLGGGGSGGGGLGSRATIGTLTNLGNGGPDQNVGLDGSAYGLTITAGSGASGNSGGANAGGGGGGGAIGGGSPAGGGGGGSSGTNGTPAKGSMPPLRSHVIDSAIPSGGNGGDGAGGGGGGIVLVAPTNGVDGQAGQGGYGGGGGGGSGTGAYELDYSVQAGSGGFGGGGGGGGVNQSGMTSAGGGNSLGGGGGGGGGPSNSSNAMGGVDSGNLGGGAGGMGANIVGSGSGGGGGGGGSGLGGAVFVDSNLNITIQALPGGVTHFNTSNNTVMKGDYGTGSPGASDGVDGSELGNSIFLRTGSSLTLMANDTADVLNLGNQVAFTDDTVFGSGGTNVFVKGNGSVIYQGTTDYQGTVKIDNANFKVNGQINQAPVFVCRNNSFSSQRGTLSGNGTLTGDVFVNSGTISPEPGQTLNIGSLSLNSASSGSLGSLVHIDINSNSTSSVAVTGAASLAGILEINLPPSAQPGQYTLLSSSGITGTFDSVTFTGTTLQTPIYTLSYLPAGAPTYVQFNFLGYPTPPPPPPSSVDIPATVNGSPIYSPAVVCCGRPVILGPLAVPGSGPTIYTISNQTGNVTCRIGQTQSQTYLKMYGTNGSCTIIGTKDGIVSNPLKVIAP